MKADKPLLLSLIRDDLVNYKLVSQLQALGLDALDYYLDLSSTVFRLMGYPDSHQSDKVYEHYLRLAKQVRRIDLGTSRTALDALANELYTMLKAHAPAKGGDLTLLNKRKLPANRAKNTAAAA